MIMPKITYLITYFSHNLGSDSVPTPFTVLKKADVDLVVGGKPKLYSVVIKVLPTDDVERHTSRRKFSDLLKFSKEVLYLSTYLPNCLFTFVF